MSKWNLIAVEPQLEGYKAEMGIEEIKAFIEGEIESIHLYDNIYALVNENGLMLKLPSNRHLILQEKGFLSLHLVGKFVVIALDGENFVDMSSFELDEAKYIFRNPSPDATVFI